MALMKRPMSDTFNGVNKMLEHYSDIHKDCYGSRPTTERLYAMSRDEMLADLEYMQDCIERDIAYDRKVQQDAVNDCIAVGAVDEATALRWLEDAYEGDY